MSGILGGLQRSLRILETRCHTKKGMTGQKPDKGSEKISRPVDIRTRKLDTLGVPGGEEVRLFISMSFQ
jgi:hypothetical protein